MKKLRILLFVLLAAFASESFSQTLAEQLGYKATDKLLIINCDDVGMCHSANLAVIDGMENGVITSGTIMVPCPWFMEIAAYAKAHPEKNFGVHLTHTAEWKFYRWGSVAPRDQVKGLYDKEGYLWRSIEEVYANSNTSEALAEGRAQVQKALDAGIRVTHIDSHMGTLQYSPDYLKVYASLALEFNLPLRMAAQSTMESFGFPAVREELRKQGLVFTDYFVFDELNNYKDVNSFWMNIIRDLKPGVTELFIHASKESEELKAITNSWRVRVQEAATFTSDPDIKKLLKEQNVILISYRPLMELQRKNLKH
jgi:chitin disaccharide deacetylase